VSLHVRVNQAAAVGVVPQRRRLCGQFMAEVRRRGVPRRAAVSVRPRRRPPGVSTVRACRSPARIVRRRRP
jgi:hypothetical protein